MAVQNYFILIFAAKLFAVNVLDNSGLDVIEEAHTMGIQSNVTMLYGHIEKPEHIVDHLIKIRELTKENKWICNFNSFKI